MDRRVSLHVPTAAPCRYGDFSSTGDCSALEHPACCEAVVKAAELCILGGVLQFLLGALQLGFIVDFVSIPVLYGFTTAAALTIGAGQIHSLIGIRGSAGIKPVWSKFSNILYDTPASLYIDGHFGWRWPDMVMAIICVLSAVGLKKLKGRMERRDARTMGQNILWFLGAAGNFFTVALGTIVAGIWEAVSPETICSHGHKLGNVTVGAVAQNCLTLTGHITAGIPAPVVPAFKDGVDGGLVSGAILVALIGYLESIAIAKSFARTNGYEVVPSQELIAIGVGNVASSFFHSFPITGSFSRTAVNSASGVATPMSGLVTGSIVMLSLLLLTSVLQYIPKAALGSIIIVAVINLFNYKIVLKMWAVDKVELIPWAISFFGCTFMSIQYGVGFGALANLAIVLGYSTRPGGTAGWGGIRPRFAVVTPSPDPAAPAWDRCTRLVSIGGSVLYPAGNLWKDFVQQQLDDDGVTAVVLDFAHVQRVDYTCLQALTEIAEDCVRRKVVLEMANVNGEVESRMRRFGYFEKAGYDASKCTQVALAAVEAAAQGLAALESASEPAATTVPAAAGVATSRKGNHALLNEPLLPGIDREDRESGAGHEVHREEGEIDAQPLHFG